MSTSYKGGPYDGFHLDTKWCTGDDEPPLGGHNPPASKEFMDSWGTKEYMRTLMKRIEEYDSKRKPPGQAPIDGKTRGGTQGKAKFSAKGSNLQEMDMWVIRPPGH
ncbi:hypothetical protein CYMTET_44383 [Cymbomonas tetramitiformis]|uniref:Uncharacterized protein n=1 Tax=Cymbomonas tetramitiformis TaxID=36881 RepID=A0AAE0EZM7_9CHLO|nr:hypothetical protein CYMTET_44385 [Cymbomonas tetramitiformis]KAK3246069.1 hypothetical protein CYMTET_44383 [Cymbomonas tetramitiformis]